MLASDKKNDYDEDNNSSSSNNENEFQELDNEIVKVIRGETTFDEDKSELNNVNYNHTSNNSQNLNKSEINPKNIKIIINKNIINYNVNNINENEVRSFNNIKNNGGSVKNESFFLNNNKKSVDNNMINSDTILFNNININFSKNNNIQNKNIYQECKSNNITNDKNICLNDLNQNNNMNYNKNINEYIPVNKKTSKKNKNNKRKKNNKKVNNNNNNNYANNNLSFNNLNINNNPLFASMNNYLYFLKQRSLSNNMYNNMIINNQLFNPININVQLENNYIDSNTNCKYINPLNNLNNNDFNKLINNNFSHYLQINHNDPNLGTCNYNNVNINNNIKERNEIFLNQLNNNPKLMNLIVNNNIIKNKNLNFINNNNHSDIINIRTNINKQTYNFNQEKNGNNSNNKRKIFNPLPDSEKEKNIINLMDILQCKDLRTTIMIKNIPNKYTITSFLEEINENFKNTYDIFYLPIDYINKCNLGFAFINFVEPFHIILFYELYRGKKWKKFNSDKICELLYAKYQGRKELISHFEKGKVLSFENEEKRPLILPVPNPYPKINLPCYYLDLFLKLYPFISYKIKNINSKKSDNSISKIFSINSNFIQNLII